MTDKICGHVVGTAQERLTCALPENHSGFHARGPSTWPRDRGVTAEAYLRIPQKVRDVVDALLKEEAPGPMLSPHAEYHERTSGIRPQVYVVLWWPWKECEAAAWLKEAGFKHSTPDCGMAEVNASYQAWTWYEPIKTCPRTFRLRRDVDDTGISGTGFVAEGVQFNNGTIVISWYGHGRGGGGEPLPESGRGRARAWARRQDSLRLG
jgi:hypothetical protein